MNPEFLQTVEDDGAEKEKNIVDEIIQNSEDEERILERVRNLSEQRFNEFIQLLPSNPLRHNLSQLFIDLIVERILGGMEEDAKNGSLDFSRTNEISNAFMLNGDFRRINPSQESINDRAFRSAIKFYEKYPYSGHELMNIFGQEYTVRPDIVIEETADTVWRHNKSPYLKQDLLFSLQYLYAFGGDAYDDAIIKNLDFKNGENYFKTGTFLEFIKKLHSISSDTHFSEVSAERLAELIKVAIDKKQGSYLLNLRARQVYEEMSLGENYPEYDKLPFLVSKQTYALHTGDNLYISDSDDFESIKILAEQLKKVYDLASPSEGQIDEAVVSGQTEIIIDIPREQIEERRRLYREILGKMRPVDDVQFGVSNKKATPEEIFDYSYLLYPSVRGIVESEFGLTLSELSLPEQFQFLNYIKRKEEQEIQPIQEFVRRYGVVGFKTFLSLEYGRELGDALIELGNTLPQDVAQRIFSKYSEIVDSAESVIDYIREDVGRTEEVDAEVVIDIQGGVFRRGRELLVDFCNRIKVAVAKGKTVSGEEIEKELELVRSEAVLFVASFKELSEAGEKIDLEQIKGVSFESEVSGKDLSSDDVERMKELYKINYEKYPEFQKMLIERFDSVLKEPGNRFFVFRYQGVIEGYYRLGVTSMDTAYFGAFNMNPKYRGSGIGEALMRKSLDVVAKDSVIEASCTATEPIASNYIERGFVGISAGQVHEIYSMDIVRHDTQREVFKSKELSEEDITRKCLVGGDDNFICRTVPFDELSPSSFDLLSDHSGGKRNVLTRYLRNKSLKSVTLVFESVPEKEFDKFITPENPFRFEE